VKATIKLGLLCRDQGDRVRARRLFEEAHSKGEMDATLSLGQLCMKQGDMVRTRQLYKEAHRKGDLFVKINLEMMNRDIGCYDYEWW
jgi:hypothetical protein